MADWHGGALSPGQAAWVRARLGEVTLVEDMSWGQVDSRVLRVRAAAGAELVVKAAGPDNHHIWREITAHESWTGPLVARGAGASMLAADRTANVLILDYLPGVLVDGGPFELSKRVHEQAGALLAELHGQHVRLDGEYEAVACAKALAWLDRPHRIPPDVEAEVRGRIAAYRPRRVQVVPTHGDWQPRNWLIDEEETVRVIDFGRFDLRPASTDLTRLTAQQWRAKPKLEEAFLRGYGSDPRDPQIWAIDQLREAVGTAVWAHQVGAEDFEDQGHRMIAEALEAF